MAASDVVFIGAIIFVIGLALFVANFAINTAINGVVSHSQVNSSQRTVDAFNNTKALTQRFDYVFLGLFVALVLALLITGWFIAGNPIFMIAYFIVVIIGVLSAGFLSNIWKTISTASVFGSTIANFPIMNQILGNLQIYMAIIGTIGLIVMFGKPYFQDATNGDMIP